MRHIFFLSALILLLASCRKEVRQDENAYIAQIKKALLDSLQQKDYESLEFEKVILYKVDSARSWIVRIPFKGKSSTNDFMLLKTDRKGLIQAGKILHIEGSDDVNGTGTETTKTFNGKVQIKSLNSETLVSSPITNGYIEAYHRPNSDLKTSELIGTGSDLPEVIVVAYVHNGISYSDWILFRSFFPDSGLGGYGYYGAMNPGDLGNSGGGSFTGDNTGIQTSEVIQVDAETYVSHPAIDIAKYLKCFDAIPDAGATCSIEIFSDIPVDNDPKKLFDLKTQFPGHTFLQIKKSNGNQSALQNIGFYPKTNWQSIITTAPVDGKFVDDSGHEFNASLKMNVSPENLHSILTEILYLARFIKYDVDEYNCTDFALDIFNKVRTKKIEIPMYDIPGGMAAGGTRTPQGLYTKLNQMKSAGDPEASNISIPGIKGWVANSKGPCN